MVAGTSSRRSDAQNLEGREQEQARGRLAACRTGHFNTEGDEGARLQREEMQQDVSTAGSGQAWSQWAQSPSEVAMRPFPLANVNAARLGVELRPWQEALEQHLRPSRSESGAAPAPQVNR
jgi:hypothetical protein